MSEQEFNIPPDGSRKWQHPSEIQAGQMSGETSTESIISEIATSFEDRFDAKLEGVTVRELRTILYCSAGVIAVSNIGNVVHGVRTVF